MMTPNFSSLGSSSHILSAAFTCLSTKQVMKEKCAELINLLESMLEEQTRLVREDL